jgi:hypothetical protein
MCHVKKIPSSSKLLMNFEEESRLFQMRDVAMFQAASIITQKYYANRI